MNKGHIYISTNEIILGEYKDVVKYDYIIDDYTTILSEEKEGYI